LGLELGEAVAAQGMFRISSAVDQLRGESGEAQVRKDVKLALAQTYDMRETTLLLS